MNALRWLPGFPVYLLQVAFMAIYFTLHKVSQFSVLAALFVMRRLYYPVVVLRRMIMGEPAWKVIDLEIGQQPKTPEAMAIADADPNLMKLPSCNCGFGAPFCGGKTCGAKPIYTRADGAMPQLFAAPAAPPLGDEGHREEPELPGGK